VTNGELINYPIVVPNVSQAKICCAQYCDEVAKKICMSCNKLYCKPCSTVTLNLFAYLFFNLKYVIWFIDTSK